MTSEVEQNTNQYYQNLEIIHTAISQLVGRAEETSIYQIIGEAVHQLIPEAFLFLSAAVADPELLRIVYTSGLDAFTEGIEKIVGVNPLTLDFSMRDIPPEDVPLYRSGKMIYFEDGLYAIAFHKVSRWICKSMEKLLGVEAVYAIGFAWGGRHYGGLTILLPRGKPIRCVPEIETLVYQASVAIQRKQSEEALLKSEERFRQLAESVQEVFWLSSLGGQVLYVSPAFEAVWGRSCAELMLNPQILTESIHPADSARVLKAYKKMEKEAVPLNEECSILRPDGSARWVWVRISPVYGQDGSVTRYAGVAGDITMRKNIEQLLSESEKLAGVGTLAAGIAHEINDPLQIITGLSETAPRLLQEPPLDTAALQDRFANINRSAWRIANIVRSLLDYTRSTPGEMTASSINDLVRKTLLLMEHQLKSWTNITIASELAPDLPLVPCDPAEIIRALINLVNNARDAIPRGGKITLRTGCDTARQWVILRVMDAGRGIPPGARARIFDPSFIPESSSEGAGFGLSISAGIVRAHGGRIELESASEAGTVISISLPVNPVLAAGAE